MDCAIIANAQYIVSEDNHFKVINNNPFSKVKVIPLDVFIDTLEI